MTASSGTPLWVRRVTTLFVVAVLLVFFFLNFSAVSTVLLGVLAATIVACAFNPMLRYIPAPRGVGAGIIGLGLIAVVGGLVLALSLPLAAPIQKQVNDWPTTKRSLDDLLATWSARAKFDPSSPMTTDELLTDIRHFFSTDKSNDALAFVRDAVLAVLLWIAFVFVGSIFLMASSRDVLLSPVLRLIQPHHRENVRDMLDMLGTRLRWWMIGTIGGMTVVFSASAIGYSISRLKFAFPLALLAGLGEVVPTVGPAIAAIVALLFAASQSNGAVVGVILTYASVQTLEAYLILPLIMRRAVKVHPAVTLFSVVFWAKVFGVPGLMMAIPINLVIGSAVEYLYILPRERRGHKRAAEVAELAENQ